MAGFSRKCILLFIIYLILKPPLIAKTNTSANSILTNKVYIISDNSAKSSNSVYINISSNFGGEFILEPYDQKAFAGETLYFTNIFKNDANHPDNFKLLITYTNYQSISNSQFSNWFETLNGNKITNFYLLQNEVYTNRIVFKIKTNAKNGGFIKFRFAIKTLTGSNSTNYIGDNNINYGGTLGDGPDGNNYINLATSATLQITILYTGPFFVSTNGADTNAGTLTKPFRTIQKAATIMSSGPPLCTIASTYIFPGIYSESISISSNNNNSLTVFSALSNSNKPILNGQLLYTTAFMLSNVNNISIQNLIIKRYQIGGIMLKQNSSSNFIINNSIYSNSYSGIYIYNIYNSNSNTLSDNNIYAQNQNYGVYMTNVKNILITKNNIHNNNDSGIYICGNSSNVKIKNNDILSNTYRGIYLIGKNVAYNKILTNYIHGYNQEVGIRLNNSSYNIIISNTVYLCSNSGIRIEYSAKSNYIANNNIFSNTKRGIIINANNTSSNYIYNNYISGLNQTNGIELQSANNNIIRFNKIIKNIKNGLIINLSSSNNLISHNTIFSNNENGININNDLAQGNYIATNFIYGGNQNSGILISLAKNNIIYSNSILKNFLYGIYLQNNASYNYILNNNIYSNETYGIFINNENISNNYIISNKIWGTNQNRGIYIYDSDFNIIKHNKIYKNDNYGIRLSGTAISNRIYNNSIYSNSGLAGICLYGDAVDNNIILSNTIFGIQERGIFLSEADNNIIKNNIIKYNLYDGIRFINSSTSNQIINNIISSNGTRGIRILSDFADNNIIKSNQIYGGNSTQNYGIVLEDADSTKIYRNLIRNNDNYGIYIRGSAQNTLIINNTIFKNLYDDGIFFDNNSYATLYNNIILSNGTGAGDFGIQNSSSEYIYLGNSDLWGNFAGPTNGNIIYFSNIFLLDPLLNTVTSFTITSKNSPAVDTGKIYPPITYGYKGNLPDMGWKEFTSPYVRINLHKSISNISINNATITTPIPGSSIAYLISFSIVTNKENATNICIFDKIPNNTTYYTNFPGNTIGWTVEYSTNKNIPDQSFNSIDYSSTVLSNKEKITWIRWKKHIVGMEVGKYLIYKIIIK